MSSTERRPTELRTPKFRVSYPHLFKPKLNELSNKYEFTVHALFPKNTNMKPFEKAIDAAVKDMWNGKKPAKFRHPIKDGDEMDNPQYEDHWVISFKSSEDYPPRVVTRRKNSDGKFIDATPKEFYGGCYAHAVVNAFAYDTKVNKGVSFGLINIQKLEDGEKFGGAGGSIAEKDFADFEDDSEGIETDEAEENSDEDFDFG